jgi:hypothetical protein
VASVPIAVLSIPDALALLPREVELLLLARAPSPTAVLPGKGAKAPGPHSIAAYALEEQLNICACALWLNRASAASNTLKNGKEWSFMNGSLFEWARQKVRAAGIRACGRVSSWSCHKHGDMPGRAVGHTS